MINHEYKSPINTELKNALLSIGINEEQADQMIEDDEAVIYTESELYDFIAEMLNMDNWPQNAQLYFDWEKYIRDMGYNSILHEMKTYPVNTYLYLYR